ncbi:ABC transporter substrate-binding protein [Yinghuangia sp. ASG 101]|uniref:ABC transporter substrate-binding protein n=1 Tax=Yinghuangia sp. ASG 101 TaxID=2896848 RepID=UPI001E61ABA1|nr:ABC transporter substrate-binding protein [Yinghuangia sp. ASG 101]UGQ14320.1 ABC transporter substrate-binding protein [Yinghuangia sp. ASG 101]
MKTRTGSRAAAAIVAALALSITACSTKNDDDKPSTSGAGSDGVVTGQGVTDKEIHIGGLTDLTGPYGILGKSTTNGQKLYFDKLNEQGGVCGRTVVVDVKDHGYDVQKATTAYNELSGKVVAFSQLIGSAIVNQLAPEIEKAGLLTTPQAWASNLLGRQAIQVTSSTYDIQMVNGVHHLVETLGLKPGDKIGHIFTEDEFGENSSAGAKYAAQAAGIEVVDQKVKPTDRDMTAAVTALKSAGVKAILVGASPTQLGPIMGVSETTDFKVPVLTHTVGFHQSMLGTAAGPAMEARLEIVSAVPSPQSDLPMLQQMSADFQAKFPGEAPDLGVLAGYTSAAIVTEAIKKACEMKDLTPAGIVKAHRTNSQVDLGYGSPLDFSSPAKPPSYATYMLKIDKTKPSGVVTVGDAFEAPNARSFPLPKTG